VGLSSEIAHSQFHLRYGGTMQLVRRCGSFSCKGHCVCAPHGSLCHSEQYCSDLNISGKVVKLVVFFYFDVTFFSENMFWIYDRKFDKIVLFGNV
jgi:uncharacterized protein (DUF486 family)